MGFVARLAVSACPETLKTPDYLFRGGRKTIQID
jgi:hypothetical protein